MTVDAAVAAIYAGDYDAARAGIPIETARTLAADGWTLDPGPGDQDAA